MCHTQQQLRKITVDSILYCARTSTMIYHIHHIHQISFWLCLTSVTGAGAPALVPLWPQHPPRASRGAFLQDSRPQGPKSSCPTLGQVEAECQVCFEAALSELRRGVLGPRCAQCPPSATVSPPKAAARRASGTISPRPSKTHSTPCPSREP